MKKFYYMSLLLLAAVFTVNAQEWSVYAANVLPTESNTGTMLDISAVADDSPGAGFLVEVIDDVDNPGNKILKYFNPDGKTTYRYNFPTDYAGTSYTLAARMKGNGDGVTYHRIFDMRWDNAIQGTRDEIRIWYDGRIELEKADINVQMGDAWDVNEWHVYRIAVNGDVATVYIDEVEVAVISGTTTATTTNKYMKFGDGSGDNIGGYVDWIAVDITGAYAPGEGLAFPDTLLGGDVSDNSALGSLVPDAGTMSPDFDPATTNYDLVVPFGTTSVSLSATPLYFASTLTGDGLQDAPGTATIVVTAQDGTQTTYTVNISVAPDLSDDASLKSITVGEGSLDPAFDPAVYAYNLVLPYGVSTVSIAAETNHANASVTGTGDIAVPGTATLTVTAENLSTQDYVITLTNADPSDNALLSSLSVSAGTLTPSFSNDVLSYDVELPFGSTTVTITAEAEDENATVSGDGEFTSLPGDATVNVLAEDGTTSKDYVIHFTIAVGIDEFGSPAARLYPNPAGEQVTITAAAGSRVYIYNAVGSRVMELTLSTNQQTLDLSSFRSGFYMVKIEGESSSVQKLIKK